jgi:hypothetical protein
VCRTARQGLRIGIGANELDASNRRHNHVLDGIAAAAADPNDFNQGTLVKNFFVNHFDGHLELLEFAIRYVVLKRGGSKRTRPGGLPLASQKEEGLGEGLGVTQSLKVWAI